MSLKTTCCAVHKAVPSWVNAKPRTVAERDLYSNAGKHQPGFRRVFASYVRDYLKRVDINEARDQYERGRLSETVSALTGEGAPAFSLRTQVQSKYERCLVDIGNAESRRRRWSTRYAIEKNIISTVDGVPVSPLAQRYAETRSAALVVEITDQQRRALQRVIQFALEDNLSWRQTIPLIEQIIGLTEREAGWVLARRAAGDLTDTFAQRLLRKRAQRIARTEVMDALAEGQIVSWRDAKAVGDIPVTTAKRWNAVDIGSRTSDICQELNQTEVPLDELFESSFRPPVDRPPGHPNCRSVLTLVF